MSDSTLAQVVPQSAALATVNPALASDLEFQNMVTLAGMMAESGMFPNAKDRNKALTLMMLGREMGFTPVQSLNGLNVINGKPSLGANLMAAKVKASGKYDYRVVQHSATVCEIEFFERGSPTGRSTFSMDDAKGAGYTKNAQYNANPRNMLFARAMSNGVKWYCPDVFGGVPVYHDGEIEIAQALRGEGSVAAVTTEPAVAESYLTMQEGLFEEEIADADAFMREVGFARDSFRRLKEAAGGLDPRKVLLEARRRGVTDVEGVIALVAQSTTEPIDAEFTEEGDGPKAPSAPSAASAGSPSSPSTPGTSAATAGPAASTEGAFGWEPPRFPTEAEFEAARTDKQVGAAHGAANARGVPEDLYAALRITVLAEFQCDYAPNKGHMMLWIGFLADASDAQLAAAIAATRERLGQGALPV